MGKGGEKKGVEEEEEAGEQSLQLDSVLCCGEFAESTLTLWCFVKSPQQTAASHATEETLLVCPAISPQLQEL